MPSPSRFDPSTCRSEWHHDTQERAEYSEFYARLGKEVKWGTLARNSRPLAQRRFRFVRWIRLVVGIRPIRPFRQGRGRHHAHLPQRPKAGIRPLAEPQFPTAPDVEHDDRDDAAGNEHQERNLENQQPHSNTLPRISL